MDYRDILIDFMYSKANRLKEYGVDPNLYFNEIDAKTIKKWSNEDAKKVWEKIYQKIFENEQTRGLRGHTCPFCIYYISIKENEGCVFCKYKDNHKNVCGKHKSDYSKIIKVVGSELKNLFSNQWYRDVVNEISAKYS